MCGASAWSKGSLRRRSILQFQATILIASNEKRGGGDLQWASKWQAPKTEDAGWKPALRNKDKSRSPATRGMTSDWGGDFESTDPSQIRVNKSACATEGGPQTRRTCGGWRSAVRWRAIGS
jgi:hypothetical protein